MKPHFLFAFIMLAISSAGRAQTAAATGTHEQSTGIYGILPAYLAVKDALVSSSAETAEKKAADLQKVIGSVDLTSLSATDKAAFGKAKEKLVFDARHISESKELDHQRDHFKTLSANMAILAKAVKLADTPVYQDYCPMKKAVWLSNEAAIKNPYYGSQMLTCGKVTETIR
jgi:type IV secretory pathway TrbL component